MNFNKIMVIAAAVSLSVLSVDGFAAKLDGATVTNNSGATATFSGTCTGVTFPSPLANGQSASINFSQDTASVCTALVYNFVNGSCTFSFNPHTMKFTTSTDSACNTAMEATLQLTKP